MKNYQSFVLISLISFLLFSCNADSSAKKEEVTEENVENLAEDLIAEQMAMVEEVSEEDADGSVTNEVEVELEEVTVDKEKELAQKKEILKEQLKESPNLGKDCESILKEYTTLVDKYVSGEDRDAVIKQLEKWANDPIYNKCKKDAAYKDQFYELEEKMYADEDEDF